MKKNRILALLLILALCMGLVACSSSEPAGAVVNVSGDQPLKVHFIDVGQADAILVQGPDDQNILIDAGNNADSDLVVDYIKKQGVKGFKAVVGTHPHEDHIGGLDVVIRSFNVDSIYMPKVSSTTKTFRDVLKAVADKNMKVTTAAKGVSIPLSGMTAEFMGPVGTKYEELNNYSAVLKLTYGSTSFLFQGDAEALSEREMLESDISSKLKADVLKLGHHGSSNATSEKYLDKVNPKYAVIMVGKGNDYGHPHKETMALLKRKGITVYRTDENGTIVAESDGKTIKFNTDSGSYKSGL
ncbi:MAG: ComEC/Rec2 family competence protein [Caulobacteraceae bacterium]